MSRGRQTKMGADRSRSRKFGDSVRKSVPCPLNGTRIFLALISALSGRVCTEPDLVMPEDPLFAAHQPGAPCLLRV